jgi:hypothetical protein
MATLDDFIRDHRDAFDDNEPIDGHFDRFAAKLDALPGSMDSHRRRFSMLRVAAVILVMISVSIIIFDLASGALRKQFASRPSDQALPSEIKEALQYYDEQTTRQLAVLDNLTTGSRDAGQISASVLQDVKKLDQSTMELKNTLAENPGDERLQAAIIRNQQMKEKMLSNIITQISLTK